MSDDLRKVLVGLTGGMSDGEFRELMYFLCVYDLKHGEEIITEGKHSDAMFVLCAGALNVLVGLGDQPVEVSKLQPGEWVGDVTMLDPGPASATVRVFVKARVYELTHKALRDFSRAHPGAALTLLEALSKNLATNLHRTSDAIIKRDQWKLKLSLSQEDTAQWVRGAFDGMYRKSAD